MSRFSVSIMLDSLFSIIILIFSVVIHEVSHGYAAYMLGDKTAYYAKRLTLNPLRHLDLFGSVLLPALLVLTRAPFVLGWAKPVPFNPYNLRNQRWGEAMVAGAGPLSNIVIAVVFGLLLRFSAVGSLATPAFVKAASYIVVINIVLAIFNLIPIPPLDGSKILLSVLPDRFEPLRRSFERYGLILVLFFVFFLWQFLFPLVPIIFRFFTGFGL